MRAALPIFLLLASIHGQIVSDEATRRSELEVIRLRVESQVALPSALGSGIVLPIRCASDSRTYARFADGLGGDDLVGIAADGHVTKFSVPQNVCGLECAHTLSAYPSDDALTVHVIGQADTTWKRAKKIEPDRLVDMGQIAKVGQIRHCMVTFDSDGKLKRETKIEVPFHVYQIAPFRNGMFVVAGADKSKKKSIVALVSQDGEFLRAIEAQGDLSAERFEKTASKSDHRPQISSFDMALNASTMVADGDRVLLLRTEQADAPVIAIPPSGESKAITIKASEGHAVFSITPSESGWMVQFVRDLGGGAVEMKLCVVDRHTGVTHRCYKPEANVGLGFACHDSDHFTFLKRDPDTDNTILLTETPE